MAAAVDMTSRTGGRRLRRGRTQRAQIAELEGRLLEGWFVRVYRTRSSGKRPNMGEEDPSAAS